MEKKKCINCGKVIENDRIYWVINAEMGIYFCDKCHKKYKI